MIFKYLVGFLPPTESAGDKNQNWVIGNLNKPLDFFVNPYAFWTVCLYSAVSYGNVNEAVWKF